jgi:hypothetical protein
MTSSKLTECAPLVVRRNAGADSTAQASDAQDARIARFSFSVRSGSLTTSEGCAKACAGCSSAFRSKSLLNRIEVHRNEDSWRCARGGPRRPQRWLITGGEQNVHIARGQLTISQFVSCDTRRLNVFECEIFQWGAQTLRRSGRIFPSERPHLQCSIPASVPAPISLVGSRRREGARHRP